MTVSFKKGGPAAAKAVKEIIEPNFELSKNPKAGANQVKIHKWKVLFNRVSIIINSWKENNKYMYNLFSQQLTL